MKKVYESLLESRQEGGNQREESSNRMRDTTQGIRTRQQSVQDNRYTTSSLICIPSYPLFTDQSSSTSSLKTQDTQSDTRDRHHLLKLLRVLSVRCCSETWHFLDSQHQVLSFREMLWRQTVCRAQSSCLTNCSSVSLVEVISSVEKFESTHTRLR